MIGMKLIIYLYCYSVSDQSKSILPLPLGKKAYVTVNKHQQRAVNK